MNSRKDKMLAFGRLLDIMDDLRSGCPWDRKQTWSSLRILTIEEMYELVDAILDNDDQSIKEEIGDLMMHMVFYAKIGEEKSAFDIKDALDTICDKLIHRHPHIYSDAVVNDDRDVKKNWEQLKLDEGKKSVLSGVPASLPAIVKAFRLQDKTAQFGFEWDNIDQVWAKVQEEIDELLDEVRIPKNQQRIEEEFGDVLFALVNYARFLKIDPEAALEGVNKKFKKRFEYIEQHAPKSLSDMSLSEMDHLWNDAKKIE